MKKRPTPFADDIMEQPDMDTIEEWLLWDGDCESTDGCRTDPDGYCEHGHPSWLLYLGLI